MDIEIRGSFDITACGLGHPHDAGRSYGEEIVALLDRVWPVVRAKGIGNKGINVAVYDADAPSSPGWNCWTPMRTPAFLRDERCHPIGEAGQGT